jgi:hypothetical protein
MYGNSVHHQEAPTGYGTFTYLELELELKMIIVIVDLLFLVV